MIMGGCQGRLRLPLDLLTNAADEIDGCGLGLGFNT